MRAHLTEHYGDRAVWLDHEAIAPGQDFPAALDEGLSGADVLLAIIGPDWATVEKDGVRRLADPDDWVRREIVDAMNRRRVRVIPVLVGDAELPTPTELPDELRELTNLQAVEVRPDRFEDDVDNLIRGIGGFRRRWQGVQLWVWLLAMIAFAVAVSVPFLLPDNQPPVAIPEPVDAVGGEPLSIDLLAWATDDGSAPLRLVVDAVSEANGTIVDQGDGTVTYTAPPSFWGTDSFGFRVIDSGGLEAQATAFVEVQLGRLGGDFNVAVARFSAMGADDDGSAERLSESIFGQLSSALAESSDVRLAVAEPSAVGPMAGETDEARAEAASLLAERIDADVVVYGSLDISEDLSIFSAEFYLSERGLAQGEELAGPYSLGSLELATSDPLALSRAASDFLEPRITALSKLAIGLSYYQLNDFADAESFFMEAADSWPGSLSNSNGREVVLHLLGNAAGLQGRLDDAESFYRQALELDPTYARSRFGIAEVLFQRSKGAPCAGDGDTDLDGLDQALTQFAEVMELPAPPLAFLSVRAQVEIARIKLCQSINGVGGVDEARVELENVVAEYSDETRLRNLVAEAEQVLAVIAFSSGDHATAAGLYESAIERTLDPSREAAFQRAVAEIYLCHLQDEVRANAAYREADRLTGVGVPRSDCPDL